MGEVAHINRLASSLTDVLSVLLLLLVVLLTFLFFGILRFLRWCWCKLLSRVQRWDLETRLRLFREARARRILGAARRIRETTVKRLPIREACLEGSQCTRIRRATGRRWRASACRYSATAVNE